MIEAIAAGLVTLTSLGAVIWSVHGWVAAERHAASVREAQAHAEAEHTRITYELEVTTKALAAANARAKALEEVLADDVNAPVAPDLSSRDWRGRLLRITQAWANEHGVSADNGPDVHHEPAAAPSDAESVSR